jgi:putative DNA primase/helicase
MNKGKDKLSSIGKQLSPRLGMMVNESTTEAKSMSNGSTHVAMMITVRMLHEQGYRVTPVFAGGKTKPFAEGQTYTGHHDYTNAIHIGVVLDNAVLLDWDGNKGDPLPLDKLADKLGLDSMPPASQENHAGDSLHFLFRLPDGLIAGKDIRHSCDSWLPHIDIKTGNQLMHIKQNKRLRNNVLPNIAELSLAPDAIVDALKARATSNAAKSSWDGTQRELSEAKEILSFISSECRYNDWLHILMGINSKFGYTEEALTLADEWSQKSPSYSGQYEIAYKLSTLDSNGGITWGTVCQRAKANGADLVSISKMFNDDGSKKRTFTELMDAATLLVNDYDADRLEVICRDSAALSVMQQRKLFEEVRRRTGVPLTTLKAQATATRDSEGVVDQLALAKAVVASIGAKNIIGVPTFTYHWNGSGVWRQIPDREIKQVAHEVVPNQVPKVSRTLIDGVTDLTKTEVYVSEHEFNVGPNDSVNCLNGEITLGDDENWQLGPHVREHYRTTQIPVEFDPIAEAPRFRQFLDSTFEGDEDRQDKIAAVLELMGYSLMAHCKHETFLILVGNGANGKSVLLAVLEQLCGSANTAGVQPSQFDRSFQRAHLHEKLVNIVTEIRQGETIDDASLKGIVSGEPTTVENKFKDPFVMRPFATCWFGTNHMPHTRDFSDALFRRAMVVPFNNTFKPELGNCDTNLKFDLFKELPGILNLALKAYSAAITRGIFTTPESCLTARRAWRLEADQVAQFVDERCDVGDDCSERSSQLYYNYRYWAMDQGINRIMTQKGFSERLIRLGYNKKKDKSGATFYGLCYSSQRESGDG